MNKKELTLKRYLFNLYFYLIVGVIVSIFIFSSFNFNTNNNIVVRDVSNSLDSLEIKYFEDLAHKNREDILIFLNNSITLEKKYLKSIVDEKVSIYDYYKSKFGDNNRALKQLYKDLYSNVNYDYYIFVFDTNGIERVNQAQRFLEGKNLLNNSKTNVLITKILHNLKSKNEIYLDYLWFNNKATNDKKKIYKKLSYFKKVDNFLIFGSGVYIDDIIENVLDNNKFQNLKHYSLDSLKSRYDFVFSNDTIIVKDDKLIYGFKLYGKYFIYTKLRDKITNYKDSLIHSINYKSKNILLNTLLFFILIILVLYFLLRRVNFFLIDRFYFLIKDIKNSSKSLSPIDLFEYNIKEFRDIVTLINSLFSKQKELEYKLIEEKENLSLSLLSLSDSVILLNSNAKIKLVNQSTEKLLNKTAHELIDKFINDVIVLKDFVTNEKIDLGKDIILQKTRVTDKRVLIYDSNSNCIEVNLNVSPIFNSWGTLLGQIIILKDMRELVALEQEISKSKNYESLGLLAGGIAHDFNNMLSGISINIMMIKKHVKEIENSKLDKSISLITKSLDKAKHLTSQLLTFSKGGMPVKQNASIHEIIDDSVDFVLSGTNITVKKGYVEGDVTLKIDSGQITQLLHNLLINARDALKSRGVIEIKTKFRILQNDEYVNSILLHKGKYFLIYIKDNGQGIPKNILSNIFQPYFSTKASGNGLGLATTFSIAKKHSGSIDVKSKEGEGTEFVLYLPVEEFNDSDTDTTKKITKEDEIKPKITNNEEKKVVIVVDDDEIVRNSMLDYLQNFRIDVYSFSNSNETLKFLENFYKKNRAVSLAIIDIQLNDGVDGHNLFTKIRDEIDKSIIGVGYTGYADSKIILDYKKFGFQIMLQKPFSMQELDKILEDNDIN